MYNIYVPFEDLSFYSNYYFNEDMSLIYATNDNENFTIVDLKNHYQLIDSTFDISSYELIEIDKNYLTNNWTYRNDLDSVLICFMYFILFFVGIPLFLLSRFFKKRW